MSGTLVDLSTVHRPLDSRGTVFFGLLRIEEAVQDYPINVDVDFQRDHVWTQEQREKFIGHVLEGGEVQPCIVNEGPGGNWERPELIDGKQRVTACCLWSRGHFPARLWDGRLIYSYELDGRSVTWCRTQIGLRFAMVRLTRCESLELYIRLNRGGTPHTDAEIERVRQLLEAEHAD